MMIRLFKLKIFSLMNQIIDFIIIILRIFSRLAIVIN